MREIVSPLSGIRSPFGGRVDPYKAAGFRPTLVADMTRDYYRSTSRQSFDDLFTHSRLGNATMVDSDGLLKWAPHNLLTYSEDFTNAAWGKVRASIIENSAVAPDGTLTADKLVEDTSVSLSHQTQQIVSFSLNATYTLTIWAKASERDFIALNIYSGAESFWTWFNLSNGSMGNVTGSPVAYSIQNAGNGWYKCSLSVRISSSGTPNFAIYVTSANGVLTYTGDGTSGIYIWGAHLYRSDLGGMAPVPADARVAGSETYVPTTSTARYLPRRHNHVYNGSAWVDAGTLIETEARTNLITYSAEFDNAAWTAVEATVTADQATSPDGEILADILIPSTNNASNHIVRQNVTVGASRHTFSVYAKSAGYSWISLSHVDGDGTVYIAYFDIGNAAIGTVSGAATANIENVGNGWCRCSITPNSAASASSAQNQFIYVAEGDNDRQFAGDGTSGIYVYGAQLEAASTPSSTIPTAGSTVTRAADTSGLTVDSSIVPWPTPKVIGDELVTNGDFATNDLTGWTDISLGTGTVSAATGAARLTGTDFSNRGWINTSFSTVVGKPYVVTFEVTADAGGLVSLGVGTSSGTAGTIDFGVLAIGVYTKTFVASATTMHVNFRTTNVTDMTIDNISVREINPLAVCIQMKGRMTYADENTGDQLYFVSWEVDTNNKILERVRSNAGTGDFTTQQTASGVSDVVSSGGSYFSPGINVPFNIASRHGSTFVNGAVDGVALTADLTPVALPDLSSTDLQIGYDFMGNIEEVRVWVVDIGDTGIAEASA